MTNIIKRMINKRSKVRTYEYTGDTVLYIPNNVTHVQFHPSVTGVHDETFRGCSKLKEIVLSDNITKIGNGSFKGCTKLKRVVLNDGLKQIGNDAFSGCTSLVSITFPSTVTTIGDRAFAGCSSLKQIIYMTTQVDSKRGWDVFHGCPLATKKYRLDKIEVISHLKELENKINDIDSTIEMRDGYITVPIPLKRRCQIMKRVGNLKQYYEVKEATTLIELAMWKAKISQAEEEVYPISRHSCHVEVPGPAKDLILQFAYTIPMYTTTCYPIYIKSSRGVEPELYCVEPSDTIANVKKQISDDKGIPVDQQRLFFNGSELFHDDRTLSGCNVVRDSIIICFEISGD